MPQCPDADRHATDPRIVASAGGAMLVDAALSEIPSVDWFERGHWESRDALRVVEGGRGSVAFIGTPVGACVLRHYHRGGWMTRLLGDRYVWKGRERTRSFSEFRLLGELRRRGLPVPAPIAARYVQHGAYYSADLITGAITGALTLTGWIAAGRCDGHLAGRVGALVARFHAAGVDHADLNAHNILLTDERAWLIDFDRGEIRASGTAWKLANLARLKRSLLKVGACGRDEAVLDRELWTPLMRAYERACEDSR